MAYHDDGQGRGFLPPKIVEIVIGVALSLIAFWAMNMSNDLRELRKSQADLQQSIAEDYVQKKDYQVDISRVYDQLRQINEKLDRLNRNR